MGANQSSGPRTVTLDNDSPAGVINISDDVVQRLKDGLAKESGKRTSATAAEPTKAPVAVPAAAAVATPRTIINPYPAAPPPPQPPQLAAPSSAYGYELTSVDVRRQKEIELQQNDAYWRSRLSQLESTLNKTNAALESEYSAAIEDVRKRFTNAPPTHQLPPCQELKAKLIACYRANPGETLRCSEEVAAFTHCVSENRVKRLDAVIAEAPKAKAA